MSNRLGLAIRGSIPGFLTSMVLSLLFLSWPMRVLQLVAALCIALFIIMRQGDKPFQRGQIIAGWFILGYALFSALIAMGDLIFPPLD